MKNRQIEYVTIRGVELARTDKAILVSYHERDMWFTLSLLQNVRFGTDGYTYFKVPIWMLKERLRRSMVANNEDNINQKLGKILLVNRAKPAAP